MDGAGCCLRPYCIWDALRCMLEGDESISGGKDLINGVPTHISPVVMRRR